MNFSEASGVAPRVAQTFSAPVNSEVSEKFMKTWSDYNDFILK